MARLRKSFPKKALDCLFVQGGAFRLRHKFKKEGEKPRCFFIVSANPTAEDPILLVSASSKVEKRLKVRPRKALVIIDKTEYKHFEKRSVIDCYSPLTVKTRSEITSAIINGKWEILEPLPENLVKEICKALIEAPTLNAEMKARISSEEEV